MSTAIPSHFHVLAAVAAPLWIAALLNGQTEKPAAAPIQLTPYTAPDHSASAGIPPGWKVTQGSESLIRMSGPAGETVALGLAVVAHNGPFQLAQMPANGIDLSMPYTANLTQKLGMIVEHAAATSGSAVTQVTLKSSTPIQVPPMLGQCGRIVATYTDQKKGALETMAVICSLPPDAVGNYKNIMLAALAPATVAEQSAPAAQAAFRSYRVPPAWLQRKLAPWDTPAPMAAGGGGSSAMAEELMRETAAQTAGSLNSANCFDLSVLRNTPDRLLPPSCR